jgi:hypothetical protein
MPAPGSPQPPPVPAQLVVGTAQSIDSGASGNPVSLRVARSANGDGFAVWKADNGTLNPDGRPHHNLWANRYRAATAAWGSPINIETSSADIDDLDLTVDPSGNATVAWHEAPGNPVTEIGVVMSAHFDTGAGAWAAPVTLNPSSWQARVASDATGAVLAVYVNVVSSLGTGPYTGFIRGRFFDPASGTWQPEAAIEQDNPAIASFGGYSYNPAALLDGSGNAFVAFAHSLNGSLGIVASNYYSRNTGGWGQLPAQEYFRCSRRSAWQLPRPQRQRSAGCLHRRRLPGGMGFPCKFPRDRDLRRASHESHPDVESFWGAEAGAEPPAADRRPQLRGLLRPVAAHRQRCRRQRARALDRGVDRGRRDARGAQGGPSGPCRRHL